MPTVANGAMIHIYNNQRQASEGITWMMPPAPGNVPVYHSATPVTKAKSMNSASHITYKATLFFWMPEQKRLIMLVSVFFIWFPYCTQLVHAAVLGFVSAAARAWRVTVQTRHGFVQCAHMGHDFVWGHFHIDTVDQCSNGRPRMVKKTLQAAAQNMNRCIR